MGQGAIKLAFLAVTVEPELYVAYHPILRSLQVNWS